MRLEDQKIARKLRAKGWTLPEIAAEVGAGKGLVSLWVRDVGISPQGLERLAKRKTAHNGGFGNVRAAQVAWSEQCKRAREAFRQEGRPVLCIGLRAQKQRTRLKSSILTCISSSYF